MPIEPLEEKWQSFGWHTMTIDGHDYEAIHDACKAARATHDKPSMIIAKTITGKGVSFLERDTVAWHGKALSEEELSRAIKELSE